MKPETNKSKWMLLTLLTVLCFWLLWPEKPTAESPDSKANLTSESAATSFKKIRAKRRHLSPQDALVQGLPQGTFEYVFDKASNINRFLLSKGRDDQFVPDSDAVSGMDLWLQDESGSERLINGSVQRAKFSPDGSKIAYSTSDKVLHIEDLQGGKLAEVQGAYGPNWKPDGSAVLFSKVPEGKDVHQLPPTSHLAAVNLVTGQVDLLTDGQFDDGRAEFNPASDWILFVSGDRTGLASFWKVPVTGGEPVQLTNVGLEEINEKFVPPPYSTTIWSEDKRWFLYDFKNGDQEETWGLEFDTDGTLKQAAKLAEGINPSWQGDGRTFVCQKHVDGMAEAVVGNLP